MSLFNGEVISLRADNGLCLSRMNRGDRDPIEAAKRTIDVFSCFKVTLLGATLLGADRIALQADNGLYLSRMNRGDSETDPIEAAKTSIDVFSEFTVMVDENGQYSFESLTFQPSADKRSVGVDLRLLRRINRGDTNPIEAARSSLDVFSKFTIIPTLDE